MSNTVNTTLVSYPKAKKKTNIPRALNENELLEQAQKIKLQGKAYSTVKSAIDAAKKAYKKNDLILIGGSTFVVGDALAETTIS